MILNLDSLTKVLFGFQPIDKKKTWLKRKIILKVINYVFFNKLIINKIVEYFILMS